MLDFLWEAGKFGADIGGQPIGCRVVEDERGGKRQAGGGFEPVAHFDRGERVETQVLERLVGVDGFWRDVAQHGGDVQTHQVQQDGVLFGFGQPVQAMRERRFRLCGGHGVVDLTAGRRAG